MADKTVNVTNERGTKTYDVGFTIYRREGAPRVHVERVDVRKEKRYGLRIAVSAALECQDWPLLQTLASGVCRNANVLAKEIGARASGYTPDIHLTAFIAALSPSKIPDSSAQEVQEVVGKMLAILPQAFNVTIAEHEKNVAVMVDVDTAQRIAGWLANELETQAEEAVDYENRLKALKAEREAKLREIVARGNHEAFVRENVNVEGSLKATERAIKTALANFEQFVDYEPRAHFFGERVQIQPADLVDGE